jgi:putative phosphoesterase
MRIGVVSDTHGSRAAIEAVLREAGKVDLWLHAGDCVPDADYLEMMSGKPVYRVAGNCDWPDPNIKDTLIVPVGSHHIFLTHGHIYGVQYGLELLGKAAAEQHCDIAVYGHTHVACEAEDDDVAIFNPGSAARPRDADEPSFLMLDVEDGKKAVADFVRFSI